MTKSTIHRHGFDADVNQACESAFRSPNLVRELSTSSYNATFVIRVNDPTGCLFTRLQAVATLGEQSLRQRQWPFLIFDRIDRTSRIDGTVVEPFEQ
jgi:hypothetical protein